MKEMLFLSQSSGSRFASCNVCRFSSSFVSGSEKDSTWRPVVIYNLFYACSSAIFHDKCFCNDAGINWHKFVHQLSERVISRFLRPAVSDKRPEFVMLS